MFFTATAVTAGVTYNPVVTARVNWPLQPFTARSLIVSVYNSVENPLIRLRSHPRGWPRRCHGGELVSSPPGFIKALLSSRLLLLLRLTDQP